MPKLNNKVELSDTERKQIIMCVINTIKSVSPEETETVIDVLMPIVKKLKRE